MRNQSVHCFPSQVSWRGRGAHAHSFLKCGTTLSSLPHFYYIFFIRGSSRDLGLRAPRAIFMGSFYGLWAPKGKLPCSRAPLLPFQGFTGSSLKIQENHHRNCLGSRAPSFQTGGLQGSSDPPFGISNQSDVHESLILFKSKKLKVKVYKCFRKWGKCP